MAKIVVLGFLQKSFLLFLLKMKEKGKDRHLSGPDHDPTDFKIPEEESDAIYLTHQEIATIYQADLSAHAHLIEYRDLFVLACLTGLRFSDFSTLKPEDLQRGMLNKK
jgi:integrase